MRKHPSLAEVMKGDPSDEWLSVNIRGFSIGDYPDAENELGSISSPQFNLLLDASESEYGTVSFNNGVVYINQISNEDIQNLNGEKPIGSINFYDSAHTGITVNINASLYKNLISVISSNYDSLSLKVAFPSLEDKNIKCLPLMSYQLVYNQERDNEI